MPQTSSPENAASLRGRPPTLRGTRCSFLSCAIAHTSSLMIASCAWVTIFRPRSLNTICPSTARERSTEATAALFQRLPRRLTPVSFNRIAISF
ncbi:MAG: hypothetical protein H3C26_20325 [Rhodocyclaceae bacterium]|nr:hypothetical protein [Rhodocyclaceae bacterium]